MDLSQGRHGAVIDKNGHPESPSLLGDDDSTQRVTRAADDGSASNRR